TNAIISALMAVEQRPLTALQNHKDAENQKLPLLGTFEGLVKKLRDKAEALQSADDFFAHKLTVGEEGIANITLSGSAQSGAHTPEVDSLAAADRYAFAGVADPKAGLGAGTVSFTYGGTSYSVNVVAGSDSLENIAAAINTTTGGKVNASVVNTSTSA